tara:strand:- start:393 stop:572 length:180 start_codon:yes stop_codon:yes gene_type:complete
MRLTEKTGTEKPSAVITTYGVVMKLSKPVKKRKLTNRVLSFLKLHKRINVPASKEFNYH